MIPHQQGKSLGTLTVTWEDKCHNHECPPFLIFFSELLVLGTMTSGMEYHCGQLGSDMTLHSLRASHPPPAHSLVANAGEKEAQKENLDAGKPCSATAKTLPCNQCP